MIPSCTEADMPERRRAGRRVAGILAVAVVATAAVLVVKYGGQFAGRHATGTAGTAAVGIHSGSTLAELNKALADNDVRALPIILERATPKPQTPMPAFTAAEATEWLETLSAVRTSYRKMNTAGRVAAVATACRIFDRFAVEPCLLSGAGPQTAS